MAHRGDQVESEIIRERRPRRCRRRASTFPDSSREFSQSSSHGVHDPGHVRRLRRLPWPTRASGCPPHRRGSHARPAGRRALLETINAARRPYSAVLARTPRGRANARNRHGDRAIGRTRVLGTRPRVKLSRAERDGEDENELGEHGQWARGGTGESSTCFDSRGILMLLLLRLLLLLLLPMLPSLPSIS
ncbi:hypothetical protein DBV15_03827 [Temnothorax longispinosus]|uniref:Uncharacterized protein n=1 Tax=Temnothorax longispinosus TaxID=300112 RepID=A0A4S2JAN4_9HYME|nr:hypothetical protein DBV15_03827 [Temnothorax longispinosus]